ncbi:hypothetical protein ACLOJK_038192 [Asimina triloba]
MIVHDLRRTAGAPDSVLHHPPQAGSHGCRRWVFRRNLHQLIRVVHHAVHTQIHQSSPSTSPSSSSTGSNGGRRAAHPPWRTTPAASASHLPSEPAFAHSSLARRQICLHQPFQHGQHDPPTTSADGLKPISTPATIQPDPPHAHEPFAARAAPLHDQQPIPHPTSQADHSPASIHGYPISNSKAP